MKKILFVFLLLFSFLTIHAEDKNAFFVWIDGTSTCYQFDDMPYVAFKEASVVISSNAKDAPVLTFPIAKITDLVIATGVYKEVTAIEEVKQELPVVRKVGKYIIGGKLIIIRDGKKYDANGMVIK